MRLVVAIALLTILPCVAEAQISQESKLKAVWVYRSLKYVQWPATKLPNPNSTIVIGVIGPDPVGDILKAIAKAKKSGNHPLQFVQVANIAQAKKCHVIFHSNRVNAGAANILAAVKNDPILTFGERPNFVPKHGTLNLLVVNNKIVIEASRKNLKKSQLQIDARFGKILKTID